MKIFYLLIFMIGCGYDELVVIPNVAYCIGTVEGYTPGGHGSRDQINFQYSNATDTFDQQYVYGKNGWLITGNPSKGDRYMVQYDSLHPGGNNSARMLFHYPVADSADYKRYKAQFKVSPPGY